MEAPGINFDICSVLGDVLYASNKRYRRVERTFPEILKTDFIDKKENFIDKNGNTLEKA